MVPGGNSHPRAKTLGMRTIHPGTRTRNLEPRLTPPKMLEPGPLEAAHSGRALVRTTARQGESEGAPGRARDSFSRGKPPASARRLHNSQQSAPIRHRGPQPRPHHGPSPRNPATEGRGLPPRHKPHPRNPRKPERIEIGDLPAQSSSDSRWPDATPGMPRATADAGPELPRSRSGPPVAAMPRRPPLKFPAGATSRHPAHRRFPNSGPSVPTAT